MSAPDRIDLDSADQTWSSVYVAAISHEVVYHERHGRDWRWLWLRHRTVTEVVSIRNLDA